MQEQPLTPRMKRAILKKVAEIARAMHQNGVNHRDFYICHFLLPNSWLESDGEDGDPPLHVIDLHRTQMRAHIPTRWLKKDLAGLHFSSMDAGLTSRDHLRFVACYESRPLRDLGKNQFSFWLNIDKKAAMLYRKFKRHYS